jgi:hypothetical protein
MATEPRTTMMTKLFHASERAGERKQIAFVQSIPEFLTAPEPITWSALDIDDERQAVGRKKAENLEIELIFTEAQYDELKALQTANANEYWFIQLPEETAETEGKPLTWNFQATVHVGLTELALDDMIKAKITLYRNTEIEESKGFPTA